MKTQRAPINNNIGSMRVFFILGRNPELSRVEILEFLKARDRPHKEIFFEENFLVVETNDGERWDVQEFGGVIWLGEVKFEGSSENFEEYVNGNELVPADKFSYAVFGNLEVEILKEKFKKEKKRGVLKHRKRQLKFQDGTKCEMPNADFYLFYHKSDALVYFGIATQEYDDIGVRNRDMGKPTRRESLAISPRLSKILINLSGAKPHDLILDPFCGVGGILQEALLKKINVYGIDKDKKATIGAEQNLKWLSENYKIENKYKIENNDSRRAPDLQFAAVATETPLGKVLRRKPADKEAKQIIQNFEAYVIPILKKLKTVKKKPGKIAITFPVVRGHHVDAKKIAEKCGLKIYIAPILESREDQFISRDIVVLR